MFREHAFHSLSRSRLLRHGATDSALLCSFSLTCSGRKQKSRHGAQYVAILLSVLKISLPWKQPEAPYSLLWERRNSSVHRQLHMAVLCVNVNRAVKPSQRVMTQSARLLSSDPVTLGQQTGSNRLCFFRCKRVRQISLRLRRRPAELMLPNRSTSCLLHWPQEPPPRLRGRVKPPQCCQHLSKQLKFSFRSFVWLETDSGRRGGLLFFPCPLPSPL